MWFLWFWLISSICCEAITVLVATTMANRLARELPELVNKGLKRTSVGRLKSFFIMLIPFLNILVALAMIFAYNTVYTTVKENLQRKVGQDGQ